MPSYETDGSAAVASQTGFLRPIVDAIHNFHQYRADQHIACILARSGGRFTDEIEREIIQRLSRSNLNTRR
jgi:hypothetical protein